jgi:hypothetical protein
MTAMPANADNLYGTNSPYSGMFVPMTVAPLRMLVTIARNKLNLFLHTL